MSLPAAASRAPAVISIDNQYVAMATDGPYLLPASRLRQAADVHRRDRQTDGRTPDRYIYPELHTMRTASIRVGYTGNNNAV